MADINKVNIMNTLRQDAYDAHQYRGVIGADKSQRAKAKQDSDAAISVIEVLIENAKQCPPLMNEAANKLDELHAELGAEQLRTGNLRVALADLIEQSETAAERLDEEGRSSKAVRASIAVARQTLRLTEQRG